MRRASGRSTPAVVQSLESRQLPSAYTATATTYEAVDLEPGQTGVTTVLDGYLDAEAFVDLGTNTFTFYGTTYTGASSFRVNPHGLIGFGPHNIGGSYVNSPLNDPAGYSTSQPLIAPLWDDWATDYSSADAVLAKIDGNRLIIEWSQVTHWPDYPADTVTFQAILQLNTGSQSGGIVFNYVDLETVSWYANGVSATVGVRAADGTASPTVVSFDATHPLVGSGKAILLTPVDTALSQANIAENQPSGSTIGTFTTTDDDLTYTYSLVTGSGSTDNASFTIVDGELRTTASLNFEAKSSHSIRVRTTDNLGGWFEREFTISVTDVNEFDVSDSADTDATADLVPENAANGALVGITAVASDADGTTNAVTYSLSDDAGGRFAIHPTTGIVTVADGSLLNYEAATSHTITVVATSADGSSSDSEFVISLTDVDEFDVSDSADADGAENDVLENATNGTLVGITAVASDADGTTNAVTYSLADDAGGRFAIHPTTGIVTVADGSLLDYESATSHTISIVATSADGSTSETVFTINVGNVAPGLTLSNATILENRPSQTVVGTFTGDEFLTSLAGAKFTLVKGVGGADNGAFAIKGNQLVAKKTLNFEARSSYSVRVQVKATSGETAVRAFTITVVDVNERPGAPTLRGTTLAENNLVGAEIGILSTRDPDAGDSINYSVVSVNGTVDTSAFSIDGARLLAADSFDYEATRCFSVVIRATDEGGLSVEKAFTIRVTNVNEAPTGLTISGNRILRSARAGTTVGLLTGFDADSPSLTFKLVDGDEPNDNQWFCISGRTLRTRCRFDDQTPSTLTVLMRVTDSGGLFWETELEIELIDI